MAAPQPSVEVVVRKTTTWTLTEYDIAEAVRKYVGAPDGADVEFDIGQYLRGATVTSKEIGE